MDVNKHESICSFFESLDEWLNDENRIVRNMDLILRMCAVYMPFLLTINRKHSCSSAQLTFWLQLELDSM